MNVAEFVGLAIVGFGADRVFGVVGSGNFHVTNAMIAAGAPFVAARHESGATTMADAYARVSGRLGVVSVHQGPGLTNATTGIAEAAKSGTPLVVLAADTAASASASNFRIDQAALAHSVGAQSIRVHSAATAEVDLLNAVSAAMAGRTVVLSLPLDVQAEEVEHAFTSTVDDRVPVRPADGSVALLAAALAAAERPVFIAGRGARHAGPQLRALAESCGALLATSAVARGLFVGDPWALGVSGGFASPLAAELIGGADLVVAWGCSLTMWTTRHGRLIGPDATVAQVDADPERIGVHRNIDLPVVGDSRLTAEAVAEELAGRRVVPAGYRSPELRKQIAAEVAWRDVPYRDESTVDKVDPRTLSIGLDDLLPTERIVAVDSGNFMGYPSVFLAVPDESGFCFTQGFQSVGLGLATAIGAALARPDRLPVAALGDGGALMSIAELETVVRLGLPMVVVIYNDAAYGAEVHHFGPEGFPLDTVRFPDTDFAAIGRGYGCDAVTVRRREDLAGVSAWLAGDRRRPLVVDAKVTSGHGSWWLEEAFRGH